MVDSISNAITNIISEKFAQGSFLFWYDPTGNLIETIKKNLPENTEFILFEGSYLAIRHKIDIEDSDFLKKRIIYIQEKPLDMSWVLDLELIGSRVEMTLSGILKVHYRLDLDDKLGNVVDSLVGKQILLRWDTSFKNTMNLTCNNLRETIYAINFNIEGKCDLKSAIVELIRNPATMLKKIQENGIISLLEDDLREYGIDVKESSGINIIDKIKTKIIAARIKQEKISELELAFKDIIPSPEKITFWSEVYSHIEKNPIYHPLLKEIVQDFESKYDIKSRLSALSVDRLAGIALFTCTESILLERFKTRLDAGEKYTLIMPDVLSIHEKRKDFIWIKSSGDGVWSVLSNIFSFEQELSNVEKDFESSKESVSAMAESYLKADGWWKQDNTFENLMDLDIFNHPSWIKAQILKPVSNKYKRWLERSNAAWSNLIENEGRWPEAFLTPDMLWGRFLTKSDKKTAVFFLDAFRAEILHLFEQNKDIKRDWTLNSHRLLSALPSSTEFGMLLPLTKTGEKFKVQLENGKPKFTDNNQIVSLTTKSDRRDYIEKNIKISEKKAECYDFKEVSDLSKSDLEQLINKVDLFFLFYRVLDENGKLLIDSPRDLKKIHLRALGVMIDRLHEARVDRIILFPDHGYISIPDVGTDEKITVPTMSGRILKKKRFLIGERVDLPSQSDFVELKVHNFGFQSDLELRFPRGIQMFSVQGEPSPFVHGGLSLQENCLLVLEFNRKGAKTEKQNPVKIKVEFPQLITTKRSSVKIIAEKSGKNLTSRKIIVIVKQHQTRKGIGMSDPKEIVPPSTGGALDGFLDVPTQMFFTMDEFPEMVTVVVKDVITDEILEQRDIKVALMGYDNLI